MNQQVKHPDGFRVYSDAKDEWRWQLWRKGRIIAESGEGYERVAKCRAAVRSVRAFASVAPVVTIPQKGERGGRMAEAQAKHR